jgi:hypothetical protein
LEPETNDVNHIICTTTLDMVSVTTNDGRNFIVRVTTVTHFYDVKLRMLLTCMATPL